MKNQHIKTFKIYTIFCNKFSLCHNLNHYESANQKGICLKIEIWIHHHSLLWKTMENHKIIHSPRKLNLGFGSRLHVGKVLPPYNAHPEIVPLVKYSKICVYFKVFIFPKNNKLLKRNIFLVKRTWPRLTLVN